MTPENAEKHPCWQAYKKLLASHEYPNHGGFAIGSFSVFKAGVAYGISLSSGGERAWLNQ